MCEELSLCSTHVQVYLFLLQNVVMTAVCGGCEVSVQPPSAKKIAPAAAASAADTNGGMEVSQT